MTVTEETTFRQWATQYNCIPVVQTVLADRDSPIRLFERWLHEPYAFLLESVEGGAQWARYSFMGRRPFMTAHVKHGVLHVTQGTTQTTTQTTNPLAWLKEQLHAYRSPPCPELPRFLGGAVGFFGYDLLKYYETRIPYHRHDDQQAADMHFMFCDELLVFDHLKQQLLLVVNAHITADTDIGEAYAQACRTLHAWMRELQQPVSQAQATLVPYPTKEQRATLDVTSNMTRAQFMDHVAQAQAYIRAGDIFQVVLSQRFTVSTTVSPFGVYRVLRTMNPSPYMYYLKFEDVTIVGASPELLVRVEEGHVMTRPIAGTRPRGKTAEEDASLARELANDPKECAEHLMLVDLGRNDLGRVAVPGSVRVSSFMEIERYSHVMHLVSQVTAVLADDCDFFDAFISCLPAGTLSGAPKVRAMEIIASLEHEARGTYGGAIGYLGFSGNLDTCITIRTILFQHGKAYIQAGAGIVLDSVAAQEYEETVNKAEAMVTALAVATTLFGAGGEKT